LKTKICTLFVSLIALIPVAAQPAADLQEILPYIDQETLVIFDIDDTLIQPTQMVGSTDWGHHVMRQLMEIGLERDDAFLEASHRLYCAAGHSEFRTVEPTTTEVVNHLQEQGIMVIGLTSRPAWYCEQTREQLESVNIDLSKTAPDHPEFNLESGLPIPLYSEGVIYTYRVNKGHSLAEFLAVTGLEPKRIVFVDDGLRNVQCVETTMQDLGIECHGFRYGAADEDREQFDPEIADLQWEKLHKILSDQEARLLLGSTTFAR
jgi:phosphoserine phosphatase